VCSSDYQSDSNDSIPPLPPPLFQSTATCTSSQFTGGFLLPSSPSQHDSSLPSVSPLSEKTTFIGFPQEILNPPYKTLWQLSNDNTLNQEDYVVNLQLLMDKTAVEPDDCMFIHVVYFLTSINVITVGSPVSKRRRVDSLSPLTDLSCKLLLYYVYKFNYY
jgi:hypothetical protein